MTTLQSIFSLMIKLQSIFGSNGSGNENLPYNPRYARQPQLETIPEVSDSRRGSGDGDTVGQRKNNNTMPAAFKDHFGPT